MMPSRQLIPAVSVALFGAVLSACGSSSATPNGAATNSPASVESAVTAALSKASTVHMATRVTQNGKTSVQVLDAGKTSGRQVLDVPGGKATILALKNAVYLKSGAAVLKSDFALSASQASKDAGKWLFFSSGSPQYQILSRGLTVGALSKEVALSSVTRAPMADINGIKVVSLRGHTAGTSGILTLYVPTSGPLLPLGGNLSGPGVSVKLVFSNWNKPVSFAVPSHASPFPAAPSPAPAPAAAPKTSKAATPPASTKKG